MTFYAHKDETIQEHSFLTYQNSIKLSEANNTNNEKKDLCALASLFHDIGKCTPQFQGHLINKDIRVVYPHGLVSALYFYRYIHFEKHIENANHEIIAHSILFHHPIENYDHSDICQYCEEWGYENNNCIPSSTLTAMHQIADELIAVYNANCQEENKVYRKDIGGFERKTIIDCFNNLMPFTVSSTISPRNVDYIGICGNLKCADVLSAKHISNIPSYLQLSNGKNFTIDDFSCPKDWNKELFDIQKKYAETILDEYSKGEKTFFEINEPVGFGKTTIYAITSLLLNKKIVIISPTNNIARNSYRSISELLNLFGIKEKVSIGLLYANQWHDFDDNNQEFVKEHLTLTERFKECQNDIIITNIDNYMRPLFKSDEKKYMAFDLSYRTAIFDEYHNYYSESGLMNCFTTVCKTRKLFGNPLTILSSATRESELVKPLGDKLLTLPKTNFNCEKRQIKITKRKIDYDVDNENMLVVCNSIAEAQKQADQFHLKHPASPYLIYHSEHTRKDRISKEAKLISSHGKNSQDTSLCVFATNIATTGLDISFKKVVITQLPINEMYQSMGRCNRFNEYECGEVVVDFSIAERNNSRSEFMSIETRYDTKLCNFEKELFDKGFENCTYPISRIDTIFYNIINDSRYIARKSEYFKRLQKQSGEMMSQLSFSYSKDYDNTDGVEYLANRVNIRTKKEIDGIQAELFIWCDGLKDDEYVNKRFLRIGPQEASFMMEFLKSDKSLQEKYFQKKFNTIYNKFNKSLNNMRPITETLIQMAKCSKTPFILFNYGYNSTKGVFKIANN